MSGQILVNDDEAAIVQALQVLLAREGYQITATQTAEAALDELRKQRFNLLITDVVMSPMSGLDLLAEARQLHPTMPVILITGFDTVETAVEAMRLGAFDLVPKPFRIKNLMVTIQRALTYESAAASTEHSGQTLQVHTHLGGLVGESPGMQSLYRMIQNLAPTDDTLLILGEDGTERQLVAQAVHQASKRDGELVTISCRDDDQDALEQRLFSRDGVFYRAGGGTLLLEDLSHLPMHLQHLLSHFLRKLDGSGSGRHLDVRLLVSGDQALDEAVVEGCFERRLLQMLNPLTITLPPLRERLEDLPLLCRYLLNLQQAETKKHPISLSPGTLRALEDYPWPGNIEELRDVLKRAAESCQDHVIRPLDLPEPVLPQQATNSGSGHQDRGMDDLRWRSLADMLRGREAEYVPLLVDKLNGDQAAAAALLGTTEETLTTYLQEDS